MNAFKFIFPKRLDQLKIQDVQNYSNSIFMLLIYSLHEYQVY
ncbi:hypothetical protein J699_01972 [Acinetobacter sp. 1000160]|nr:hypothetical protein J522_1425 [Acinetobacter baumannii 146457]EYT19797.1 hypothetical protein J699_01972 [Acinetobacter sp. 1000160]